MVPSELSSPLMLGRYALYEKLASGGMASVYIGRLIGPVGFARTVAIKRMHPHVAEDPEFVSMFLDEARLAARIRHPNVVPTLDVVAMAGELFLVMELVQGEALSRLIRTAAAKGERIPPSTVAAILVGVLHGLHAAHEAKSDHGEPLHIVHRDVSPQNVMVGTDGGARVLDFGVAKAVGRMQTTRDGQLKGKLAYMAPEQIRGAVARTADVYAASVVLWESLTGQRLFHGENEAEIIDKVLHGTDVAPSRFAEGVPPALDEVTMRGLSVDPANRFQTAREMALAIERAIPLATASTVGDWVENAARQTLDERSAKVARVESDSAVKGPGPGAVVGSTASEAVTQSAASYASNSQGGPEGPKADDAVAPKESVTHTQLSSGTVSSPRRASIAAPRSMRSGLALGAAALVLLGVGGVVLTRGQSTRAQAPSASSPVVSPAAEETAPAPASASAPPLPALAPSVSAAPRPTVRGGARPIAPPPPATPATSVTPASPKPNCNPNFAYDADGNKIFKPECFGH